MEDVALTFEGRRESLAQANKLSRTYAILLDALNRHRGKGQQKVTVEHVPYTRAAKRWSAWSSPRTGITLLNGPTQFMLMD